MSLRARTYAPRLGARKSASNKLSRCTHAWRTATVQITTGVCTQPYSIFKMCPINMQQTCFPTTLNTITVAGCAQPGHTKISSSTVISDDCIAVTNHSPHKVLQPRCSKADSGVSGSKPMRAERAPFQLYSGDPTGDAAWHPWLPINQRMCALHASLQE